MNPNPCCRQPVENYWRGTHCRCCGSQLQRAGAFVVGCNRAFFGLQPCEYCNQNTCGPHSHDGHGPWQVRRYCELGGGACDQNGSCPEHGMEQG